MSFMCALNAHADDDDKCSEGLLWLKWNVVVSVLSGIAVLNRQKRKVNERSDSLMDKQTGEATWGILEILLGIFWLIWMIVGLDCLRGLDEDCAEGVQDWMVVAVVGGFIVPAVGGCCWCGINFCAALIDEDS